MGLIEIDQDDSTGDGHAPSSKSQDAKDIIQAVDGIKLNTRHLEEAYKGGILTLITAPMSRNVVAGVSAAFKTGADSSKYKLNQFEIMRCHTNFMQLSSY